MVEWLRFTLPPSSSGPGRGPLKAKTRVRTSLGAQNIENRSSYVERFFIYNAICMGVKEENRCSRLKL
jgi:hypothetical protein